MQAANPITRHVAKRTTSLLRPRVTISQAPTTFLYQTRSYRPRHPLRATPRPQPSAFQYLRTTFIRRFRQIRHQSTEPPRPDVTSQLGSPEPSLSLSQRMKKLSREYGWSALGVYLGLSALDFPFCFLAVRMLGTDRIGEWEHAIVGAVKGVLAMVPGWEKDSEKVEEVVEEGKEKWNWGVDEAQEKAGMSNATLWTQLALAYAIHKSFIFIRVPITAAVTPKVVKTLRGWGWDIGKRKPKA